jgi:hypothetical protein
MKLFWEKKSHLILSIIWFLLLFISVYAVAPINSESAEIKSSKLVKLEPRPAVKLEFILIKPDNPVAAVILLEGGMGILKLGSVSGKPKVGWGNGFLSQKRALIPVSRSSSVVPRYGGYGGPSPRLSG